MLRNKKTRKSGFFIPQSLLMTKNDNQMGFLKKLLLQKNIQKKRRW